MTDYPRVSVIVPNFNYARFLRRRIDSILSQTYQDFELILLDDASSDDSLAVIDEYRDNPHVTQVCINDVNSGGVFYQWKRGLSLAKGEYVWIAEADDYAAPGFLENCVSVLDANPDVDICQAGATMVDENEKPIAKCYDKFATRGGVFLSDGPKYMRRHLRWRNTLYNASGILFRRSAVPEGVFEIATTYRVSGDWVFWVMMAEKGGVAVVREKLSFFRRTSSSVSSGSNVVEDVKVFLWLCDRGWFKLRSPAWYFAIADKECDARKTKYADDVRKILSDKCGITHHSLYRHYFYLVRFLDNIHRGSIFPKHRKV
ncbi:MAG: glycosyltransferase [Marinilabiliaceae bacterium]